MDREIQKRYLETVYELRMRVYQCEWFCNYTDYVLKQNMSSLTTEKPDRRMIDERAGKMTPGVSGKTVVFTELAVIILSFILAGKIEYGSGVGDAAAKGAGFFLLWFLLNVPACLLLFLPGAARRRRNRDMLLRQGMERYREGQRQMPVYMLMSRQLNEHKAQVMRKKEHILQWCAYMDALGIVPVGGEDHNAVEEAWRRMFPGECGPNGRPGVLEQISARLINEPARSYGAAMNPDDPYWQAACCRVIGDWEAGVDACLRDAAARWSGVKG